MSSSLPFVVEQRSVRLDCNVARNITRNIVYRLIIASTISKLVIIVINLLFI